VSATESLPNPNSLPAPAARRGGSQGRGRLRVFLGAGGGTGKTRAMLEEARRLVRENVEVIVGFVESTGRDETDALLEGLESLPSRWVESRGARLREFDLEAAIARRPSALLVDNLAHTNAPGSKHAKRWQDVRELLDAGIGVYATLNIQNIESQHDLVVQVTRVAIRETVPDTLIEEADDVTLIDLPSDELLEHPKEGNVRGPVESDRTGEGFLRRGDLIALRQLALRYVAERVDRQLQVWRRDGAVARTWPGAERLLVCVGPSPQSPKVVRAAKRMALRLQAELIAVYVETPAAASLGSAHRERVVRTLQLAEQLGAESVTLTGDDVTGVVLRYARERNVSKILIGKPSFRSWRDRLLGSAVDRLARRSGDIDITFIQGLDDEGVADEPSPAPPVGWHRYGWSVGVLALCTLLCAALFRRVVELNLVMIYLAGVVFVATRFGTGPSILASILSVLAFDFFFVPPTFTFAVADSQYLLTFIVRLAVALVVSTLAVRTRQHAESATERERRTAALYSMSRELASTQGTEGLATVIRKHVEEVFHGHAHVYLPGPSGKVQAAGGPGAPDDQGAAQWAYDHKERAGLGSRMLPDSRSLNVPLEVGDRVIGVLGFVPREPAGFLTQPQLLETFATQAAVALERERLTQQAGESRLQVEAEKLRNTLLSAISHDLRTPLAAIKGAASLLLKSPGIDPGVRLDLTTSIHEEADYINRMVANLLDLTRLESGAVRIQKEGQSVEEIVGTVTDLLEKGLKNHPLTIRVPAELPMVPMDGSLVQQVLFNLLDNAIHHTPPGTPIDLSASADAVEVTVEVADRGPGIKAGEEQRIFDKFYRLTSEGKRAGMGLGLALCEAIVRIHGGRIRAENRPKGGAAFRFTLPLGTPR
jgi:two-component system sensor histidine kinase KdpD